MIIRFLKILLFIMFIVGVASWIGMCNQQVANNKTIRIAR